MREEAFNEDGWPEPQAFECEWTDMHSDMYPEFAPDPIEVPCREQAQVIVSYWSAEMGLPEAHQFCAFHFGRWVPEREVPRKFAMIWKSGDAGIVATQAQVNAVARESK